MTGRRPFAEKLPVHYHNFERNAVLGIKFEAIDDGKKFKSLQEDVEICQIATKVNSEDAAELLSRFGNGLELTKEAVGDFLAELKEKYDINIPLREEPTRLQLRTAGEKIRRVLILANTAKNMEELRKKATELEIRIAKEKDKKDKNKK